MPDKKPELSAATRKDNGRKVFTKNPIIGTKFTIAISSAKGGVGKSTFATNLAIALKHVGCKVGLLDADIYGPSMPTMFDMEGSRPLSVQIEGQSKMEPIENYGVKVLSIGCLLYTSPSPRD